MRKRSLIVLIGLLLVVACAAQTPLKKAKVAQDVFISTLEATAESMPAIEETFPAKVGEVKKVYMQAKMAVQAYQHVLRVWEKTGERPVDYQTALAEALKAIGELQKLGTSMGVKYEQ